MKAVYKYPLIKSSKIDTNTIFTVKMKKDAKIIKVAIQETTETLYVWALVETEACEEVRTLAIYGTGFQIDHPSETLTFIDTILQNGGQYCWHLFELYRKVTVPVPIELATMEDPTPEN